jgi:hypothetical protein
MEENSDPPDADSPTFKLPWVLKKTKQKKPAFNMENSSETVDNAIFEFNF